MRNCLCEFFVCVIAIIHLEMRIGIKNYADKIKRELMYEINRYINSLFKIFYLCIELR